MDKEFNDSMVSIHTLLEEYKFLMTTTPCGAMKDFFRGRFFENLRKLEAMIQQQNMKSRHNNMLNCEACRAPHCTDRQKKELTAEELLKYNGFGIRDCLIRLQKVEEIID